VGPSENSEPVLSRKTEPVRLGWRAVLRRAHTSTHLGTLLRARSEARCRLRRGGGRRGRAGQAFGLGKPGVADGTTANPLAASCRGPQQDGPAAKTKLLAGSCLRIWARAWGQREPADERTGRSNGPVQWLGSFKGGLDIPSTHAGCSSLRIKHPIRTLTRRVRSHAGRFGIFISHPIARSLNDDRLPVMHQPVDQGRCQGVVHIKQGAPFPEGSTRDRHDRSGFITGSDHLEQQIGPALVDGQMAQLIEEENGTSVATVTCESGGFMIAELIEEEK
jgi:hypothetical protein